MQVIVRTPDAEWFQGPADSVTIATDGGLLQIFSGHASLQGVITFSTLQIRSGEYEEDFVIRNGMLVVSVATDEIRVLAMQVEKRSSLSHKTAKEYLESLLKHLEHPETLSELHLRYLEGERYSIERALEFIEEENAS